MTRQRWFERTFRFQLEPANHHDVIARLMSTPLLLHTLTRNLAATKATARSDDRWSIQENVGHLLDLETLWDGRTDDLLAGATTLRPADLENRRTHEARHNDARLTTLVEAFARTRGAWIGRRVGLATADPAHFARSARHPRLDQPMRLIDHCVFVAEHDAHHLGRILQLLAD